MTKELVNHSFRTVIKTSRSNVQLDHKNQILSLGSCFANHIGNRLKNLKFNILLNPFGTLYNPVSIFNSVRILGQKKHFGETDLIFHQGIYSSWYHHSDFSSMNAQDCLSKINQAIVGANHFLQYTDRVLITYGTARVYNLKSNGETVSNCHKIPASEFIHQCLNVAQIQLCIEETIGLLQKFNPAMKIILTVSPIRHLKDGFEGNMLSKASLIVAIHQIISSNPDVFYFPSYEILMDDLRDYRFYEKDMLHPNEQAIDYIWMNFIDSLISEDSKNTLPEIDRIMKALAHRPSYPNSPEHISFCEKINKWIENLHQIAPYINFESEIGLLNSQRNEYRT